MKARKSGVRGVVAAILMTGTAVVIAGCSDLTDAKGPPSNTHALAANIDDPVAEFHRRNSMDVVGQINREFMERTTASVAKTKKFPRMATVCTDAVAFIKDSKRSEWVSLAPEARQDIITSMNAGCARVRANIKSKVKQASFAEEIDWTAESTVGDDFWRLVDYADGQADAATDLSDLATRYNAILDSTAGRRWIDSVMIEVVLAASMSQAEYLWTGSAVGTYADAMQSAFDSCEAGLNGVEPIEIAPGETINCEDGEMVRISNASMRSPSRSQGPIQLASYISSGGPGRNSGLYDPTGGATFRYAVAVPGCGDSLSKRGVRAFKWAMGGAAIIGTGAALIGGAAGAVAGAAAGGVGAFPGAIAGAKAGGATGAAVGAIVGGLAGVIVEAYEFTWCISNR